MQNDRILYVDTHTHLWDSAFKKDFPELMQSLRENLMAWILDVGVDIHTSQKSLKLAESDARVFAAVGVHPHESKGLNEESFEHLMRLSDHPRCVAIGEIGLDFYRNLSPRVVQELWFRKQLEWALRAEKPLILHVRDAYPEVLAILEEYKPFALGGVVHCFQSTLQMAEKFIELGFFIGLGGPITYAKSTAMGDDTVGKLSEFIFLLPLDHILTETDCPYLTPQPFRGKRNEPRYVKYVVEKIAQIKGKDIQEVCNILKSNAETLFLKKFIPLEV